MLVDKIEDQISRRDFIKGCSKLAIVTPFSAFIEIRSEARKSEGGAAKSKYEKSQKPITGIIISRYHNGINLEKNPEYNGWVSYSNETVKLGSSIFVFGMETIDTKKLLSVSVLDVKYREKERGEDRKKESLIPITRQGSKISFPQGNLRNLRQIYQEETYFREDTQAGRKRVDRIKVLEY